MAKVVDRIRAWSAELKYWEQAALELVAKGASITEAEYQRLVDLCMHDIGLIRLPGSSRPPLSFVLQQRAPAQANYRLRRIFNLQNVNALPCGQEIVFGEWLTLIYGDNGSGKTGYVRPFGSAAFARGERDVLPDATKKSDSVPVPQADIELDKDGTTLGIRWTRGESRAELAGCYIFDAISVHAHLSGANSLSFSPSGLSLLKKLAELTDEVRSRLKRLLDQRDVPHNLSALFRGDSEVSFHVQRLSADSDLKTIEGLAQLNEKERARIKELEGEIARVKSEDIPTRAAELRKQAADLRRFISSLAAAEELYGEAAANAIHELLNNRESAKRDAERSGAERFRIDSFSQVGTEVWREFLLAAKSLADAEEPDGTYPLKESQCLLCRQQLSSDAADLIRHLWSFLASDATAKFEAAEAACSVKRREIEQATLPYFGDDSNVRRTVNTRERDLVFVVENEVQALRSRKSSLIESLKSGKPGNLTHLVLADESRLAAIAEAADLEATSMQSADVQQRLQQLEKELLTLQHRVTLSEQLPSVRSYIETQQWIRRGRLNLGSTYSITAKHNELFTELVTERFITLFQTNLSDLNRNVKVTIETRGKKGETVRQILLSPEVFCNSCPVEGVLSEGEKRAVALADFLTEATLDDACTAIVLDDPVTSFDLGCRKVVAQKLAELARDRQVVVFTHDPVFLYQVKAEAKALSVGTITHWIQRGADGTPGLVFLNNGPGSEGQYRSGRLAREWYAKAKSAPPQEQQSWIEQGFSALRTSYEAFIVFDLFSGVVERWEERIKYDQLAQVHLDKEIVDEVVAKLALLSRYITAHLHSDAFIGQKPTPAELFDEIQQYEALKAKHKERKKSAQQAPASPKPLVTSDIQQLATSDVAIVKSTPEGAELDRRSRLINHLRGRN